MTSPNTFKSSVAVLLIFAALYFVVLGFTSLAKAIKKKKREKEDQ